MFKEHHMSLTGAQDVKVQMENLLARFPADADKQPVAWQIEFGGDLFGGSHHPAQDLFISRFKVIKGRDVFFGNDQEMRLGPGVDVRERKAIFVFVFDFCRYFFRDDLTENTVVIHDDCCYKKDPLMLTEGP